MKDNKIQYILDTLDVDYNENAITIYHENNGKHLIRIDLYENYDLIYKYKEEIPVKEFDALGEFGVKEYLLNTISKLRKNLLFI